MKKSRVILISPLELSNYSIDKFVSGLRKEYEYLVNKVGISKRIPFVIEGGFGIENYDNYDEWKASVIEMSLEGNLRSYYPVEILMCYDTKCNMIVGIIGVRYLPKEVMDRDIFGVISMTILEGYRRYGVGTSIIKWLIENRLRQSFDRVIVSHVDYNLVSKYFILNMDGKFVDRVDIDDKTLFRYEIPLR